MAETTPSQTQTRPANVVLTDDQLRAAVYYAVGAATEGGKSAYKLAIAANRSEGTIDPVAGSGYTVGTLQTDLGSHPETAKSLVSAYHTWASQHHPDWLLSPAAEKQLITDLQRNANAIKKQHGRDIDASQREHINAFLASDPGQEWLYQQDKVQLDKLMKKPVKWIKDTSLYKNATPDDQIRLAVVSAKAFNQSETDGRKVTPYANKAGVSTVDGFMAAVRKDSDINKNTALIRGVEEATKAANLTVALRQANNTNPLKAVWAQIEGQPLPNPSQPMNANLTAQYAATRSLFIEHQNGAPELIAALNHGQPYPAHWRGQGIPSLATDGRNLIVADQIHPDKVHALSAGGEARTVERGSLRWSQTTAGHTRDLQLTQGGQNQSLLQAMPAPVQTRRRGRSLSR